MSHLNDRVVSKSVHEAVIDNMQKQIERLTDLVRFCRSYLHDEQLITDDEYAKLLEVSGSPFRLGSYDEMREALKESVKLQAHYAALLNMHDGGERKIFISADQWMERLAELRVKKLQDDSAAPG